MTPSGRLSNHGAIEKAMRRHVQLWASPAFTVGGIGTIEAAATTYLISAEVPASLALAVVLTQHATQFLFTTAIVADDGQVVASRRP